MADATGKLKIAVDATPTNVTEFIANAARASTAKATAELQQRVATLEGELGEAQKTNGDLLGKLQRLTIDEVVRQAATEDHSGRTPLPTCSCSPPPT